MRPDGPTIPRAARPSTWLRLPTRPGVRNLSPRPDHLARVEFSNRKCRMLWHSAPQAAEAQAREKRLAETLRMRETKIEELVGCLSPALAPMLEPKILALRDEVEAVRLEMDALRTKRLDVEKARDDVKRMVQGLEGVPAVLGSGTLLERREILRGLIQGIVLDPATGAATITFFEVPRTPCRPGEGGGATSEGRDVVPGNGKSTSHCDPCSSYSMAGASSSDPKKTEAERRLRACLTMALIWVAVSSQ